MKFVAPLEHRAMLADQRKRPLLQPKLRGVSRSGPRAARRRGGRPRRPPRRDRSRMRIIAPVPGRDHPAVKVEDPLQLAPVECGNWRAGPGDAGTAQRRSSAFHLRLRAGRAAFSAATSFAQLLDLLLQLGKPCPRRVDSPRRTACRRARSRGCSGRRRPAPAWPECRPSSRPAAHPW